MDEPGFQINFGWANVLANVIEPASKLCEMSRALQLTL